MLRCKEGLKFVHSLSKKRLFESDGRRSGSRAGIAKTLVSVSLEYCLLRRRASDSAPAHALLYLRAFP